ncbi:src y domain-containing protein [Schizosaccharomyces octosporus yFS286]|uniref:Src y domain-containing protein n=1 Tax=Schizosaccharomyces octosporus (strain yFS286) TaxID=483514 RepID=S9PZT7_SCHOY|nr:src y domain-containing protein [Schizosaccharomyces octosporus yFS286]EPX72978.1 src y domain-containing protein [Schizosaccharomyces octosporus yFS286]
MVAEQDYAGKLARLTKSLKGNHSGSSLKDFYKKVSSEIMNSNKEHLEAYRYFQLQVFEPLQEHVNRAAKRSPTSILSIEATEVLMASMENFILYTNPEFSQQPAQSSSSSFSNASVHPSEPILDTQRSISPTYIEYAELENRTSRLSEALTMLRLNPLISSDLKLNSVIKEPYTSSKGEEVPFPLSNAQLEHSKDTIRKDPRDFRVTKQNNYVLPSSYSHQKEGMDSSQAITSNGWESPLTSPHTSPLNNIQPENLQKKSSNKDQTFSTVHSSNSVQSGNDSLEKYFSTHPLITPDGFPIFGYVRALYNYRALLSSEISMQSGDILIVLNRQKDGWWKGRVVKPKVGNVGLFPSNYIQELDPT